MAEPQTAQTLPRRDPVRRPVDGDLRADQIRNKAKDRHYVLVDKSNGTSGNGAGMMYSVSYFEALGYEVELQRKGGPEPVMGKLHQKNDGSPIEVMGQVLMSCPLADKQARDRSAQEEVDQIEERIVRPTGLDNIRGFTGMRIKVEAHDSVDRD